MKYLLFIFLIALITCQVIEDNLFTRMPTLPLKRFYDNLRKEGISQKYKMNLLIKENQTQSNYAMNYYNYPLYLYIL